jgi:histone deacetylase 1/2/histone deacetylase 8
VHHSSPTFYPPPTPLSLLTEDHPFSLSIPLEAHPSNKTYAAIWPSIQGIRDAFKPDYVLLQMGADALAGDPVGKWGNWSTHGEGGMVWVAQRVKEWGVPLCVLGGGGYNHANTARAWAAVTAVLAGSNEADVPHHDYFPDYAPNYTLEVHAGGMRDENTHEHITRINDTFARIAERIRSL